MGHDFLRIRGGGYLTSEPIEKIQMSIKEPKRVDNYFLVLFNQPLNSPMSSWAVIALGKGEYGQPSILAGLLDFDHMLSQGISLIHYPHVEEESHILHSRR